MKANNSLNSVAKRFDTFTSVIFNCNNIIKILLAVKLTIISSILIIAVENDASICVETFCYTI